MNTAIRMAAAVVLATAPAGAAFGDKIDSRACRPVEVGVFANRLHVKCAPIPKQPETEDITYFAMSMKEDERLYAHTLSALLAAKGHERELKIWYDRSDYKSVPGCKGGDCRRLTGVVMY